MSLTTFCSGLRPLQLAFNSFRISVTGTAVQERHRNRYIWPKKRHPEWLVKQERTKYEEDLTPENKKFLQQVVCDTYGPLGEVGGVKTYLHTPLKKEPILRGQWFPKCRRAGLIGIKLGYTQQWFTNGKSCQLTMIQIVDNHVIKYIPPEENVIVKRKSLKKPKSEGKLGCLLVGSVNCDPQQFTKEYNGLFAAAGVMPKKILTKFPVDPCAAIQPGTPLYAAHFKVGDVLDITGITINRGFQGVIKRWGFRGMPATHGTTKTHRRPGNIGGTKARVWPGTKMPGVMGSKLRVARGVKILRIDHKYNVLYILGRGIPGDINSFVYLHDTILPLRRLKESPRFPTYYPEDYVNQPLPDEEFAPELFNMSSPSIIFEDLKRKKCNDIQWGKQQKTNSTNGVTFTYKDLKIWVKEHSAF